MGRDRISVAYMKADGLNPGSAQRAGHGRSGIYSTPSPSLVLAENFTAANEIVKKAGAFTVMLQARGSGMATRAAKCKTAVQRSEREFVRAEEYIRFEQPK